MGRVGVGAGCTVAKSSGFEHIRPGGQGWAVRQGGGVTVGAMMAVNALGNILDDDGGYLAGPPGTPGMTDGYPFADLAPPPRANTVIGCLVTDAKLTKAEAVRACDLAHSGIARAVDPVHTAYDGDALFLLTTQQTVVAAPSDVVSALATWAVADAIRAAVRASASQPFTIPDDMLAAMSDSPPEES